MSIEFFASNGVAITIDEADADLAHFRWNIQSGGYATRSYVENGKRISSLLHRVVLERMLGRALVNGEFVDHINGDTFNNTRSNLRPATRTQNQGNRKINANSTSGYKGVGYFKSRKKWIARISVGGKQKTLGYFDTPQMAAQAYNEAALKHFGEFSRLNDLSGETIGEKSYRKMGRPKGKPNKHHRIKKGDVVQPGPDVIRYKGVTWNKGNKTWMAQIVVNYQHYFLGNFKSPLEAARAYNEAAIKHRGALARLNDLPEE